MEFTSGISGAAENVCLNSRGSCDQLGPFMLRMSEVDHRTTTLRTRIAKSQHSQNDVIAAQGGHIRMPAPLCCLSATQP